MASVGQTAKSGLKVFLAPLIFKSAGDQFGSEDTTGAGTRLAVKFGHELIVQGNPYAHQFSPLHRRGQTIVEHSLKAIRTARLQSAQATLAYRFPFR